MTLGTRNGFHTGHPQTRKSLAPTESGLVGAGKIRRSMFPNFFHHGDHHGDPDGAEVTREMNTNSDAVVNNHGKNRLSKFPNFFHHGDPDGAGSTREMSTSSDAVVANHGVLKRAITFEDSDSWQSLGKKLETFTAMHRKSEKELMTLIQEQTTFLEGVSHFVEGQVSRQAVEARAPPCDVIRLARVMEGEDAPVAEEKLEEKLEDVELPSEALIEAPQPAFLVSFADAAPQADEVEEQAEEAGQEFRASQVVRPTSTMDSQPVGVDLTLFTNHRLGSEGLPVQRERGVSLANDGLRKWSKAVIRKWMDSRYFDPVMGIVISLNAANIGWTIDRELRNANTDLQVIIEDVFLGIFCAEIGAHLWLDGLKALRVPANMCDFAIIFVTILTQVIKPMLELTTFGVQFISFMDQMMILRMLRLLRLARAVRLVASFRSLWKLVQGLLHSVGTMVSALLLMFITIYIFACVGAEFISKVYKDDPDVGHLVQAQFSSMPKVLLTLFQFISMDSTASFYVPLIHRNPWLTVYFMLLLILVAIALMNLITALLVEDAINSASMDEEMTAVYIRERLSDLEPNFRRLFQELDTSGDGYVQAKEIKVAINSGMHIPTQLQDFLNPGRVLVLFEALDRNNSGELSEDEFVDGLMHMALADVPLETIEILHLLRCIRRDSVRKHEKRNKSMSL